MTVEKNQHALNMQVTEGLNVAIIPDSNHEFTMTTKEVATGYGVHPDTIRSQKRHYSDEFVNGKHFISGVQILHSASPGSSKGTLWTKRGIVRLGFFIKSKRARLFRDWAEDLVIQTVDRKKRRSFAETNRALREQYVEHPDLKRFIETVENAAVACGSQSRLAERLGINASALSLIRRRPWLVSDEKQQAIVNACRNLLERNAQVDTEAIEYLLRVDDYELRMSLFTKMRKGGLL